MTDFKLAIFRKATQESLDKLEYSNGGYDYGRASAFTEMLDALSALENAPCNDLIMKDHHHADLSNMLRDKLYPRFIVHQCTRDVVSGVISEWRQKHSPNGSKIMGVTKNE